MQQAATKTGQALGREFHTQLKGEDVGTQSLTADAIAVAVAVAVASAPVLMPEALACSRSVMG